MSSLRCVNRIIQLAQQSIGASETDTPVTDNFPISAQDSSTITIDLLYDDATVAAGITAKLQSSFDGGTTWIDSGTVAITGAVATTTHKIIDLDMRITGDQGLLPLRNTGRVVITTGAGDSLDLDAVYVSRRIT